MLPRDDEIAANYKSNEVVEANYVLKTCGFPPTGMQFKAGMNEDTVCGDPTGQTDCATTCFKDLGGRKSGEECVVDDDCASGTCLPPVFDSDYCL